ncbi:MAG: hypothetical protein KF802_14735 [Bdellovibrionaceae bacterium]|nr:hypothetical protein [Pseudobdellovibrionaceae bacterium]
MDPSAVMVYPKKTAMLFYVEPFEKGESIRSALGFMSLTSRWGNVLFPGITVLTRDLFDVLALHSVAIDEMNRKRPNWAQFRGKGTDVRVAHVLTSLARSGIIASDSKRGYRQRMTYWQRYGSLLNHFNMLTSPKALGGLPGYRRLIFDPNYTPRKGQPWEKNSVQRETRIVNATWYRDRGYAIQDNIDSGNLSRILDNQLHYWWITGLEAPARGVSDSIKLARRLEFALTVWQTTFEAAIQCVRFKNSIPKRSGLKEPRLLREFLLACLQCKESGSETRAYRDVVAHGLQLHEIHFRRGFFKGWSESIKDVLDDQSSTYSFDQLAKLHDGTLITNLADLPSEKLLPALVRLHNTYCKIQNKPGSIYLEELHKADRVNQVFDRLSLELTAGRWGLFGYRFGASLTLYESPKYRKGDSDEN